MQFFLGLQGSLYWDRLSESERQDVFAPYIPAFVRRLEDDEPEVREAAAELLGDCHHHSDAVRDDIIQLAEWTVHARDVRADALGALGNIHASTENPRPSDAEPLMKMATSKDEKVRRQAASSLWKLSFFDNGVRVASVAAGFPELLKDESALVRGEAERSCKNLIRSNQDVNVVALLKAALLQAVHP